MPKRATNSGALTLRAWPEAGKLLGLGRNATYEAIRRNEIPHIKIGKRLLIPRAALDRLLQCGEKPAA